MACYQPDDHHQDSAPHSTGRYPADDGADIETAAGGGCPTADKRTDDLRADAATDHTGNRVADNAEVELLQQRAAMLSRLRQKRAE